MARDVEGVSYIAVLHQRTMEKLVEILSLVSLNIEGTTAAQVTSKKTKPANTKNIQDKPDGLGIFRQKLEEAHETTHTVSTPSCDVL